MNKVPYYVCPVLYSTVVTVGTPYCDVKKLKLLPHSVSFDPKKSDFFPKYFPQFQQTDAHNCHLIHNNIFKNIRLLHV